MTEQLLSAKDVATRLQVSLRSAQRIIRSIPHINIGSGKKNEHLRITEDQLQSYIDERTVMPMQPKLSKVNPRIIPRVRTAGIVQITRRPPDKPGSVR